MTNNMTVNVEFTGTVCHKISEAHSRPIRGTERALLQNDFSHGLKPLKKYLEVFDKTDINKIVSGNFDGLGLDTRVFCKISSESHSRHRADNVCINSLQVIMNNMKSESGYGFIQKISAVPFYILFWSLEGLKLYHKLAHSLPLFWDATGNVVRRGEDGKQFLYYELTIASPDVDSMGIPVSAMISNDQSLPGILDWMERFRQAEKKQFGFHNLTCPTSITSDQSWIFIIAALKIFNEESLAQYLKRMWQNGKTNDKIRKTTVHLCCSHIMNNLKKMVLKHAKKNVSFQLRCLALLINITTMEQASEILFDVLVALSVPKLNDEALHCINRLISKMNNFSVLNDLLPSEDKDSKNDLDHEIRPTRYTEENFLNLADESPFRTWGNKTMAAVQQRFSNMPDSMQTNVYVSDALAKHLLSRLIPILPLWSALYNENLSSCPSFSQSYKLSSARTNGTIENRFRLLKHICLGGKKSLRLDDFSVELQSHTVSIQRLSTVSYLKDKSGRRTNKLTRCKNTIREQWNKKQKPPLNIATRYGRFQRPPDKHLLEIKLTDQPGIQNHSGHTIDHSSIDHLYAISTCDNARLLKCPMANINNSCWFNSVLQSIAGTFIGKAMVAQFIDSPVCLEVDNDEQTIAKVCEVLCFMCCMANYGKPVPYNLLQETLKLVCNDSQKCLLMNKQNDVGEFINGTIACIAQRLQQKITIDKMFQCKACGYTRKVKDESIVTLSICLSSVKEKYTLQELLIENFEKRESDVICKSCCQPCMEHNKITGLPVTIFVIINRFTCNQRKTIKLLSKVVTDEELDFLNVSDGVEDTKYALRSVICHIGLNSTSGHYTTYTFDSSSSPTLCDDMNFSYGQPQKILEECYVAVYDRIYVAVPDCIPSLIQCLSQTSGIDWSLQYLSFRSANGIVLSPPARWQKILEEIRSKNVHDVLNEFDYLTKFTCINVCKIL